jgi:hypothetical protein
LLTLSPKSSEGTSVAENIEAGLLLELHDTVIDEYVVKDLSTEIIISISSLDFVETFLNGEN